jgi:hypothetical protein
MIPVDKDTLLLVKHNYAELDLIHSRSSFISQIYHIICPKCGLDNIVDSRYLSDGTFRIDCFGYVTFRCKHCEGIGSIPVYLEGT